MSDPKDATSKPNVEDLPTGETYELPDTSDKTGLRQSHFPAEKGHNQQDEAEEAGLTHTREQLDEANEGITENA